MRKSVIFLISILCIINAVSAQNSFYYYHGNKIVLVEDTTKMISIVSNSSINDLIETDGATLVKNITDSQLKINIYKLNNSSSRKRIKEANASKSITLQSCYFNDENAELIPNGYINIKLKDESDYEDLVNYANLYGCTILGQNKFMPLWYNLYVSPTADKTSIEIANNIYESGEFAASFPSFTIDDALEISYDPDVYKQWGLYNSEYEDCDISISKAWNYATGRGIKIAIVDQGIDLTHQDLRDNIYYLSYDTMTDSSPSKVYDNHGTHCAGIAAAVRNNGIQIAGVAPDAKLMSISNDLILSTNLENNLANGINWAWKNGADIISCSWWCTKNELLEDAIDNAVSKGREGKGCVFVKSAGNYTTTRPSYNITYPGGYSDDVIAVSNMQIDGSIHYDSCYGSSLFIAAPGTAILSTLPNDEIGYKTGTSMACPHVSGVAALILERNPALTAKKVREIMAKNAKKIGTLPYDTDKEYGTWNEHYGYGLIDAYQAVINTPRQ
jgi:subtilisin family serine protease